MHMQCCRKCCAPAQLFVFEKESITQLFMQSKAVLIMVVVVVIIIIIIIII